MSPSGQALRNLRAIVILIVLGFHSMLAYLVWVPVTAAPDLPVRPYAWRTFPIIDSHRFSASTCSAPVRTSTSWR
jgi:hypothetical protein